MHDFPLFRRGNLLSDEQFNFPYIFFDDRNIVEIFKMTARKHFFHHSHTRVATEVFFGNMRFVLSFGQQVDNFIDLLHESLFCEVKFFENVAMKRDKEQKSQKFDSDDCENDNSSEFSYSCEERKSSKRSVPKLGECLSNLSKDIGKELVH
jgi:hypothetical protein